MINPSDTWNISHYKDETQKKLEIFSEGTRRETARQGGWRKNDQKGKGLFVVVLMSGLPSDMTRIEFKGECNEVGLYSLAIGKVDTEGEHFRVTLKPKASSAWRRQTEKSVGMR